MSLAMAETTLPEVPQAERTLLIVEDDKSFLQRLARAMEQRGFTVTTADTVADGLVQVERTSPAFAVVDMRLADGNGLEVISALGGRTVAEPARRHNIPRRTLQRILAKRAPR